MALALFITPCLCKVFLGSENLNQPAHICVVSKQPNHSLTWAENKAAVLICCHKVEQFVHSCFIIAPTISKRAFLFTWPNYQIWILPFLHSRPETSQEYPTRIRTVNFCKNLSEWIWGGRCVLTTRCPEENLGSWLPWLWSTSCSPCTQALSQDAVAWKRRERCCILLHCVFYDLSRIFPMNESINHAHFPASAVMYSSQEIVFGAGAVRDCRLAGWTQDRTVGQLIPQSSHRSTHRTT